MRTALACLAFLLLALLTGCRTDSVVLSPTPAAQIDTAAWPRHVIPPLGLSVSYPPGWNVFDSAKALQITPNSQPAWSSFADPNQPNDGPTFDLLYNLNRPMGATPQEEHQILLRPYDGQLEVVETAAALFDHRKLTRGVYRFPQDGSILLLGAVEVANGRVVALVGTAGQADLDELRLLFDGVLRSIEAGSAGEEGPAARRPLFSRTCRR